ncbi:MAG TPA: hypothetical protein VEC38_00280 [Candidatus Binataceae bacterium]|nr:hypothetical protein [Candidatus Binataceae bacterium]
MTSKRVGLLFAAGSAIAVAAIAAFPIALRAQQAPAPQHPAATGDDGDVVVTLCDGKTNVPVKGLKPGEQMSHERALAFTRGIMADWQRKHPGEHWEMAQAESPSGAQPAAAASPAAASGPAIQQGDTYASFHERDYMVWQAETQKFVDFGNKVFHSDKLLGSTIGVSCDMCHPNAANTHPESYPKYQVQLQRVALLRDMIDWCIENPVKGVALKPDDERLRALEAYILAQRRGVPLSYGKH